jgi:hypothetical protein
MTLKGRCFRRALIKIENEYFQKHSEDADYVYYKIKGYAPLFFRPRAFNETAFCQVVSETFYQKNWHYFQIKETMVQDGDVVVDCGAAEGLFSFAILPRAKHIYAVEPVPLFVSSMRAIFSGIEKITIRSLALSDKAGQI